MRQILSSVRCDSCFKQEDFANDEEEMEAGWYIVHKGDEEFDLCDQICLREWAEAQ